jgi:hypothetical protein
VRESLRSALEDTLQFEPPGRLRSAAGLSRDVPGPVPDEVTGVTKMGFYHINSRLRRA